MHIEIKGSGPALVLIHGWAMHGGLFAPLIERLADRYTLYAVDLPGHGRSRDSATALTLDACAEALLAQLPPAAWLGWSLGALIAARAAIASPSQVQALIALAGSPCFVRRDDWPHGVDAEVFHRFGIELAQDYRLTIDRFLALEAHGSDHMREELRDLRAQVFAHGDPAPSALVDGLGLLEHSDLRASLADLQTPALWIAGRRDRLVSWRAMQSAAESMPRGEFLCVEGAGHAAFLSHPDRIAQALGDFLPTRDGASHHDIDIEAPTHV